MDRSVLECTVGSSTSCRSGEGTRITYSLVNAPNTPVTRTSIPRRRQRTSAESSEQRNREGVRYSQGYGAKNERRGKGEQVASSPSRLLSFFKLELDALSAETGGTCPLDTAFENATSAHTLREEMEYFEREKEMVLLFYQIKAIKRTVLFTYFRSYR